MEPYRDSSGRRLDDYPRPSVAVDTAVLTFEDEQLKVVLAGMGSARRLPGTFLHEGERLSDAVRRSIRDKVGIQGLQPQQLRVFDRPDRDDRGWVLSVAHLDVVPLRRLPSDGGFTLRPVTEATGLQFDHDEIVRIAVDWLRARYEEAVDPCALIEEEFTLRDLQRVHEAVAGTSIQRDNFRRRVKDDVEETGGRLTGVVGKPPRLFRKKARD